jgi:hypothetical protein
MSGAERHRGARTLGECPLRCGPARALTLTLTLSQPAPDLPLLSHHSRVLQSHTPVPFSPQIKHDGAEVRTTPSTRAGTFWDDSRLSL